MLDVTLNTCSNFFQAAVFRCHLCTSAFAYKYERTKHLRRFHKVKGFQFCQTMIELFGAHSMSDASYGLFFHSILSLMADFSEKKRNGY